ncbi:unnamed protein product [Sphenostylis stenocarpa]|uniref:Uncharacterized protein n=1 Tax=Sphenostylis stenocarpa TaxID=92480 RepID=A0AA86VLZ4_9FABA|nr:unnamed protein product [Sphenostylis stenocarpa]
MRIERYLKRVLMVERAFRDKRGDDFISRRKVKIWVLITHEHRMIKGAQNTTHAPHVLE